MKRFMWGKEEINSLIDLYVVQGLSYDKIATILNDKYKTNRNKDSVHIKVTRLKLRHTKEQTFKIKSENTTGNKNPMYGKDSPNKGLNKDNSERIRLSSEKISSIRIQMFKDGLLPVMSGSKNPMYGKIPWCFGLTKYTDERLLNSGIKGSKTNKIRWANKSEGEKRVIIEKLNDSMINQHKPTKIEIKVGDFIISENITFIKNYKLNGFYIDFYLVDYNICLECDGDWWHVNPLFYDRNNYESLSTAQKKSIIRDSNKNKMFEEFNIPYLRFWECDIHKNFESVKNSILTLINNLKTQT